MAFFAFHKDSLLLYKGEVPDEGIVMEYFPSVECISEVSFEGNLSKTGVIPEGTALPPDFELLPFRPLWKELDSETYALAGKCKQILHWDNSTRFCPRCGNKLLRVSEIQKTCPECSNELFPHVSPCIIVLVTRGDDEILMVKSRSFKGNFYGLVAGFVETGESLEQCVERELMEETGLKVKNIRYAGSQPWPYPSQLMMGFTAEYESGQIHLQDEELCAGGFFHLSSLPQLPSPPSLARRLIDAFLSSPKVDNFLSL